MQLDGLTDEYPHMSILPFVCVLLISESTIACLTCMYVCMYVCVCVCACVSGNGHEINSTTTANRFTIVTMMVLLACVNVCIPHPPDDANLLSRLEVEREAHVEKAEQRSLEEVFERFSAAPAPTMGSSSRRGSGSGASGGASGKDAKAVAAAECQRVLLSSPPLRHALIGTLVALYLRGDKLPLYARVSMLQGPLADFKASRDNGPEAHFRHFLFSCLAAIHGEMPAEVSKAATESFGIAQKHIKSADAAVKVRALELATQAARSLGADPKKKAAAAGADQQQQSPPASPRASDAGAPKGGAGGGGAGGEPGSPTSSSAGGSSTMPTLEVAKLAAQTSRDRAWAVRRGTMAMLGAAGAANELAGRGFEEACRLCAKAFDDDEWQVAKAAADALGALIASAPHHGASPSSSGGGGGGGHLESCLTPNLITAFSRATCAKRNLLVHAWLALFASAQVARRDAAASSVPYLSAVALQLCDAVDEGREETDGKSAHVLACVHTIVSRGALPRMQEAAQMSFIRSLVAQLQKVKSSIAHVAVLDSLSLVLARVGQLSSDEDGAKLRDVIRSRLQASISYQGSASNSSGIGVGATGVRIAAGRALRALAASAPGSAANLLDAELKALSVALEALREKRAKNKAAAAAVHGHAMALAALLSLANRLPLGLPRRLTSASIQLALDLVAKGSALPDREAAWQIIAAALRAVDSSVLMSFRADIMSSLQMSLHAKAPGQLERIKGGAASINPELTWRCAALEAITAFCNSTLVYEAGADGCALIRAYLIKLVANALRIVNKHKELSAVGAKANVLAAFTYHTLRAALHLVALPSKEAEAPPVPVLVPLVDAASTVLMAAPGLARTGVLEQLLEYPDAVLNERGPSAARFPASAKEVLMERPWEYDWTDLEATSFPGLGDARRLTFPDAGFVRPLMKELADTQVLVIGKVFAVSDPQMQMRVLGSIESTLKSAPKIKDAEQRSTVAANAVAALLAALKLSKSVATNVGEKAKDVARLSLVECGGDISLQRASAEALAHATRLLGESAATAMCKALIQESVAAVDPSVRSALTLALGCLHRSVGGMALSSFVRSTVDALISVASEPVGDAHVWALYALSLVVDSAGLSFVPHVRTSLDLCAALLMRESLYAQPLILTSACLVNATVAALGPELVPRSAIFARQAGLLSEDEFVGSGGTGGGAMDLQRMVYSQQLLLFAPHAVPSNELCHRVMSSLFSPRVDVRRTAISTLKQLIERNAEAIDSRWGTEYVLFAVLDKETDAGVASTVMETVRSLFGGKCVTSPGAWISSLSRIALGMPRIMETRPDDGADDEDDEDVDEDGEPRPSANQSSASAPGGVSSSTSFDFPDDHISRGSTAHSSTRAFAAKCLSELPTHVEASGDTRHLDLTLALEAAPADFLVLHLSELFSLGYKLLMSSAPAIAEHGMTLLVVLLRLYGPCPDPEFEGHALLEQYQAQIISVLRASLAQSALPRQVVCGCELAAGFILFGLSGGDVTVLRRILSFLAAHLDQWEEAQYVDFAERTSALVRVALLDAFARLSVEELRSAAEYRVDETKLVQKELATRAPTLVQHWSALLFDYVVLCGQPDQVRAQYQPRLYAGASLDATRDVLDRYEAAAPAVLSCLVRHIESRSGNDSGSDGHVESEEAAEDGDVVSLTRCIFTAANMLVRKAIKDEGANMKEARASRALDAALEALLSTVRAESASVWLGEEHALELVDLLVALSAVAGGGDMHTQGILAKLAAAIAGLSSSSSSEGASASERVLESAIALAYRCAVSLLGETRGSATNETVAAMEAVMDALVVMSGVSSNAAQGILALAMELLRTRASSPALPCMVDGGLRKLITATMPACATDVRRCCVGSLLYVLEDAKVSPTSILPVTRVACCIGVCLVAEGASQSDSELASTLIAGIGRVASVSTEVTTADAASASLISSSSGVAAVALQAVRESLKDSLEWASSCVLELGPSTAADAHALMNKSDALNASEVMFVSESMKVLVVFGTLVSAVEAKRAVMGVLVPLLIEAIAPTPPAPRNASLGAMALQLVTHMATSGVPGFKEVVASLPPQLKERMQRGLQSGTAVAQGHTKLAPGRGQGAGSGAPSINLKMSFTFSLPKA